MKLNINDFVKVTLTDTGKKMLVRYYARQDQRPPDSEWNEGKFQMWFLFEVFGSYVNSATQASPFEHNIIEIETGATGL